MGAPILHGRFAIGHSARSNALKLIWFLKPSYLACVSANGELSLRVNYNFWEAVGRFP